jgi:hypothetical protein
MPVLRGEISPTLKVRSQNHLLTLAVVLLHDGNAFAAASMASLVSVKPISGTDPSSSAVAGSTGASYLNWPVKLTKTHWLRQSSCRPWRPPIFRQ